MPDDVDISLDSQESVDQDNESFFIDDEIEDDEQIADIQPLAEDLLLALDALNSERDKLFGITENITQKDGFTINDRALIDYAKKHGIGQLVLLIRDSLRQLGYTAITPVEFMHKCSGVVVRL